MDDPASLPANESVGALESAPSPQVTPDSQVLFEQDSNKAITRAGHVPRSRSLESAEDETGALVTYKNIPVLSQDVHSGNSAPIHRLHFEILSMIFTYAVDSQDVESLIDPGDCPAEWVAAHTCHTWRQVAFSSANLWTRIVVPYHHNGDLESRPVQFHRLKTHLANSNHRPIDVTVACIHVCAEPARPSNTNPCNMLLEILCNDFRLRSFVYQGGLKALENAHAKLGGKLLLFPLLERLEFGPTVCKSCKCWRMVQQDLAGFEVFKNAPNLKSFEIRNASFSYFRRLPPNPLWPNLTNLILKRTDNSRAMIDWFLGWALSLQNLQLNFIFFSGFDDWDPMFPDHNSRQVTHSSLSTLSSYRAISLVGYWYTLPNLKSLTIHLGYIRSSSWFESFFNRSGCRLDFLRIDGWWDPGCFQRAIKDVLCRQLYLTRLHFGCCYQVTSYTSSVIHLLPEIVKGFKDKPLVWENLEEIVWSDFDHEVMPYPITEQFALRVIEEFRELEESGVLAASFPKLRVIELRNLVMDEGALRMAKRAARRSELFDASTVIDGETVPRSTDTIYRRFVEDGIVRLQDYPSVP